jgi:hypothetical protein
VRSDVAFVAKVPSHDRTLAELRTGLTVREVARRYRVWGIRQLVPAIELARKHGAALLAESTDRYLRHHDYKSTNPVPPTDDQFRALAELAGDVPLVTVLPPDATHGEVRSQQIKRGQQAKGRKGGRPTKARPGDTKRRLCGRTWLPRMSG